jgi:ankyrin repeat protein
MQNHFEKLVTACINDDVNEVKRLSSIVKPTDENDKGYNAIDIACIHGSIDVVSFLIKSYHNLVSHFNARGFTPGHAASRYGKVAIVRLLIQNKAKDLPNKYKTTPSMSANETKTSLLSSNKKNIPAGASINPNDYIEIIDMWKHPQKASQKIATPTLAVEQNPPVEKPAPWASKTNESTAPQTMAPSFAEIMKDQATASGNSNTNTNHQPIQICDTSLETSNKIINEIKRPTNIYKKTSQELIAIRKKLPAELSIKKIIDNDSCSNKCLTQFACSRADLIWSLAHSNSELLVEIIDEHGNTNLHYAATKEDDEAIYALMDNGVDITQENHRGFTALHEAAAKAIETNKNDADNCKALRALLSYDTIQINHANSNGFTALHSAARYGKRLAAEYLINLGADPLRPTTNGQTARDCAQDGFEKLRDAHQHFSTHESVIAYLERAEQDTQPRNLARYRRWMKAGMFADLEMAFIDAIEQGNSKEFEALLIIYPNIFIKANFSGLTTLHIAASCGQKKILIELKKIYDKQNIPFPINAQCGIYQETPLHLAVIGGHDETVRWLLDNKADPSVQNIKGFSALHEAAAKGQNTIIEIFFKERHYNVNSIGSNCWPVIFSAARYGHFQIVQTLITCNARLDLTASYGETILDIAIRGSTSDVCCYHQHREIIELLLKNRVKYNKSLPPYIRPETRKLLVEHGELASSTNTAIEPQQIQANEHDIPEIRKKLLQIDIFTNSHDGDYNTEKLHAYKAKPSGSNPGAIYENTLDHLHWLGKMGYETLSENDESAKNMGSRTRIDVGIKLDATKEKMGMDFYSILAPDKEVNNSYEIPETKLANLPIQEKLIIENTFYNAQIQKTFPDKYAIKNTVFVMSRWCDEFRPLHNIANNTLTAALKSGLLPESIQVDNNIVSTNALVRLLAHARLLGDIDVFGIALDNIGFKQSSNNRFLWFKVDGTHIFQGGSKDDYLCSEFYREEQHGDPQNLQYYAAQGYKNIIIEWKKLTTDQRELFLLELDKGLALCQDTEFSDFMWNRNDAFQQYGIRNSQLNTLLPRWKHWFEKQEKIYKDEPRLYKTKNPELIKQWLNEKKQALGLVPINSLHDYQNTHSTLLALPSSTETTTSLSIKGKSTRIIDALHQDFKDYWKKNECWQIDEILNLATLYTQDPREIQGILAHIAFPEGIPLLVELLLKKGVSQNEINLFKDNVHITGDTIGVMLNAFRYALSATIYEEQPFFNLMTLLQNWCRHQLDKSIPANITDNAIPIQTNNKSNETTTQSKAEPSTTRKQPTNLTPTDKTPSLTPELLLTYSKNANEYYAKALIAETEQIERDAFKHYHCAYDSYTFLLRQNFDSQFCEERTKIIQPKLEQLRQSLTKSVPQNSVNLSPPFQFSTQTTAAAPLTFFSPQFSLTTQGVNQYPPSNYHGEELEKEINANNKVDNKK